MPDVRADLIDLIWDLHKDARNFKPRGVNWDAFSIADLVCGAIVSRVRTDWNGIGTFQPRNLDLLSLIHI